MIKLFTLLLLVMPFYKAAPPATGPIDHAAALLKANNIHELSKMFASSLEVSIADEENIYTAAQAEQVLTNFFKNGPVKSVQVLHRVNSNANIRFAILALTTTTTVYRTAVSFKLINGQFLVNEIRIESGK